MTSPRLGIWRPDPGAGAPPLAGIRIVDFTRVLAGPFATQILGDLGADVIKIENPRGGDDTRALNPQAALGGESTFFLSLNRSKRSVAIDLKSEQGRRIVLDLLATADVLVENFSGAVMRRFQLDHHSLRGRFPRLIYCSVSGYGRSGRNADAAGYDSPVGAEAGVLGLNAFAGGDPVLGGVPYTDITTALNAAIGILAALQARARDGIGQHVDIAMFDTALANLSFHACDVLASGREPARNTPQSPGPRGLFATADGSVVITCSGDKMFRALCQQVIDRAAWLDDPRFATAGARLRHAEPLLAELRAVFATAPSRLWSERCKRAGIPCGAVRTTGEAVASEEAADRGLVFGLAHPAAGVAPAIAQPLRLSGTPCRYEAPPLLGQHTREVLGAIPGYDADRIAQLAADGTIALGRDEDGTATPSP